MQATLEQNKKGLESVLGGGGPGPCWWCQPQTGRSWSCSVREVPQRVCVQGGRGQPQSYLHASWNLRSLTDWWLEVQLLVYREKSRGEGTQPWGEPVLMVWESETCFPSLTCCLLSDRKSVIHLQVESGTLSWESLSYSNDGVEGRAEVHKQDSGLGSCGVQVLEDKVKGHVYCIVYRPVGSVGKLQGVQERVSRQREAFLRIAEARYYHQKN